MLDMYKQPSCKKLLFLYALRVLQSYLVAPHEQHFHLVHRLLQEHIIQEPDDKIVFFCTTAMVTAFMYALLRELKMNVREIHSRKPQPLMNFEQKVRVEDSIGTVDTSIKEA